MALRPSDSDRAPALDSTLKLLLAKPGEKGTPAASPPRITETVLLVEDEPAVRALARLALLRQGYAVVEAADGQQALAVMAQRRGPVHLLVTDVVMPHMGGRELAERLTAACPGLRVLLISGYTDDEGVRDLVSAGRASFLPKPFTMTALAQKVREALDAPESPP